MGDGPIRLHRGRLCRRHGLRYHRGRPARHDGEKRPVRAAAGGARIRRYQTRAEYTRTPGSVGIRPALSIPAHPDPSVSDPRPCSFVPALLSN
eukprot:4823574-Pyramimonas_sp.AAC.2